MKNQTLQKFTNSKTEIKIILNCEDHSKPTYIVEEKSKKGKWETKKDYFYYSEEAANNFIQKIKNWL